MNTIKDPEFKSVLTKRRIGLASFAAVLGCVACCAVPLLAAAGLSGGALAAASVIFRPGLELVVAGAAFVVTLGLTALFSRLRRKAAVGCGPACERDGSCCERGTTRSA